MDYVCMCNVWIIHDRKADSMQNGQTINPDFPGIFRNVQNMAFWAQSCRDPLMCMPSDIAYVYRGNLVDAKESGEFGAQGTLDLCTHAHFGVWNDESAGAIWLRTANHQRKCTNRSMGWTMPRPSETPFRFETVWQLSIFQNNRKKTNGANIG